MIEPDMLTLRELAGLLRVSAKTAYSLTRQGGLPGFKVGGQWRFRRVDIESWSKANVLAVEGLFDDVIVEAEATSSGPRTAEKVGSRTINEKTAALGFEDKLWRAADLLRSNMDPAEYKHVVLALIFLKYVSDAFEERQAGLRSSASSHDVENREEFAKAGVFWVPQKARWSFIQAHSERDQLGGIINDAMEAIESDNPSLADTLPTVFATPTLDSRRLGELVNLISSIGLGSKEHRAIDTLGRVYEYFLSRFASAEGRGGGEFYTPTSIVRLLVEVLEPYEGRVYDPCCGSGGMFVQSMRFTEAHGVDRNAMTVFGQESNRTTWRIARMNMAVRGIRANLGNCHADTFHNDLHPELLAEFVLANPPFNISNWGGERLSEDGRWKFGVPPTGNANFAWLQHILHHLSPTGTAGVVLANGSMSAQQSGEGAIRRKIVEADLVDCMIALPGQLFYATQIPVCVWFLARDKQDDKFRDRRGEVLFIDARRLGRMETRVHRVLDAEDIESIASTYHSWRNKRSIFKDVPGYCRSVSTQAIAEQEFVLTPGRYVGAEDSSRDGEPFEEKINGLTAALSEYRREGQRLDARIHAELTKLGFEA